MTHNTELKELLSYIVAVLSSSNQYSIGVKTSLLQKLSDYLDAHDTKAVATLEKVLARDKDRRKAKRKAKWESPRTCDNCDGYGYAYATNGREARARKKYAPCKMGMTTSNCCDEWAPR